MIQSNHRNVSLVHSHIAGCCIAFFFEAHIGTTLTEVVKANCQRILLHDQSVNFGSYFIIKVVSLRCKIVTPKIVIIGDDIHRKEYKLGVLTVELLEFSKDNDSLEQLCKQH